MREANILMLMYFIMDVITQGAVLIVDNLVDLMIKSVSTVKFRYCLNLIGVNNIYI